MITDPHAALRDRVPQRILQAHQRVCMMALGVVRQALLGIDRAVGRPDASDRVQFVGWAIAAWTVTLGAAVAALVVGSNALDLIPAIDKSAFPR